LHEPKGNYYAALTTDSDDDPQLPSITQHSSGEGVDPQPPPSRPACTLGTRASAMPCRTRH
jgi:hypothetical protein